MKSSFKRGILISGVAVCGLIIAFSLTIYILYAPVDCDSAYYIHTSHLVAKGYNLYTDIGFNYTPLVILLLTVIEKLFRFGTDNTAYLLLNYCIIAIDALLVYRTARALSLSKRLSTISLAAFCTTYLVLNADAAFLLEPASLLFGLAALLLALLSEGKWHKLVLAGLIASLSFWSKQYGAGFFFLCLIAICLDGSSIKEALKKAALFTSGYIITFILCFIFWRECIEALLSVSYGTDSAATAWYSTHRRPVIWAIEFLFYRYAPFILGILLLPFAKKSIDHKSVRDLLLLFCGIAGFMGQYYFAQSQHYFIYIIPFTSILLPYLWLKLRNTAWTRRTYLVLASVAAVMTLYTLCYDRLTMEYFNYYIPNNIKQSEYNIASDVKSTINPDAAVFNANTNSFWLNYLAELTPSKYKGRLYSDFGPLDYNEEQMQERLESADYAIYNPDSFEGDYEALVKRYMPEQEFVKSYPYKWFEIKIVKNLNKVQ